MEQNISLISPETGFIVSQEVKILILSVLLGMLLGLLWCAVSAFDKSFGLDGFILALSDILKFAGASVLIFLFTLKFTFGQIRIYIIAGMLCGFFIFKRSIYSYIFKLFFTIFAPFAFIFSFFRKIVKK